MNCQDMQNQILLAHSGELPDADAGELQKHIAACPACRQYRDELEQVFSMARETLPAGSPSPAVMGTIMSEARRVHAARQRWVFPLQMGRVLAYAAAALILVGGLVLLPRQGHLGRIEEVNALLVMVGEKQLPAEPAAPGKAGKDHELKALAKELLRMEGLGTDDLWADPTPVSERAEPQPTTFQFRSTDEGLQEICG